MQAVLEYTEQALQPGTLLGPYRLINFVKQGGMSTVYLGYNTHTRAHVALNIAPEILEGNVDVRSEVYSVGILLYEMLTGSVPFDGPNDKICLHHRKTQPLAPSFLNPSLPRSVERVILRALEKAPRRRYQTVEDLLCAFQKALDAPPFFEHISSRWKVTYQKLCDCLSPETSDWQRVDALAAPTPLMGPP